MRVQLVGDKTTLSIKPINVKNVNPLGAFIRMQLVKKEKNRMWRLPPFKNVYVKPPVAILEKIMKERLKEGGGEAAA